METFKVRWTHLLLDREKYFNESKEKIIDLWRWYCEEFYGYRLSHDEIECVSFAPSYSDLRYTPDILLKKDNKNE